MELRTLDDDEFLRLAHAQADSLTDTTIQIEALRRLEAHVEAEEPYAGFRALSEEYGTTPDDVRAVVESTTAELKDVAAMLDKLNSEGIDNLTALDTVLKTVAALRALASDAGDVFTRAAALFETTQKE